MLDVGFPDIDLWIMTFAGIAAILIAIWGRGPILAGGLGFLAGMVFYVTHLSWSGLYLGPLPWIALATLQAIIFAAGCVAISLLTNWLPRLLRSKAALLVLMPLLVAGLWTGREEFAGRWPYGGFAWGRVALAQSQSPFAEAVSWIGVSGLSFIMVWIVATCIVLAAEARLRNLPGVVVLVAITVLAATVPTWPTTSRQPVTIAAVQGNGPAGYFATHEIGDVLTAQLEETRSALGNAAESGRTVDLIVWPEDGADLDPLQNPTSRARIDQVIEQTGGTPLVFGTITERDGRYFNSSILWERGIGPTDLYDKKRPVPFGEFVPDRAFWSQLAPDLIGLVGRDYTPGTRDGILNTGGVAYGSAICFDIADDTVMRTLIEDGAQVILAQSNNADFGRTDESLQQLAIARLRAIETGRDLVNISTVGTSAIISATGETLSELTSFEPGTMITQVTPRDGTTGGVVLGPVVSATALIVAPSATLAIGLFLLIRSRRASITAERDLSTGQER